MGRGVIRKDTIHLIRLKGHKMENFQLLSRVNILSEKQNEANTEVIFNLFFFFVGIRK